MMLLLGGQKVCFAFVFVFGVEYAAELGGWMRLEGSLLGGVVVSVFMSQSLHLFPLSFTMY